MLNICYDRDVCVCLCLCVYVCVCVCVGGLNVFIVHSFPHGCQTLSDCFNQKIYFRQIKIFPNFTIVCWTTADATFSNPTEFLIVLGL